MLLNLISCYRFHRNYKEAEIYLEEVILLMKTFGQELTVQFVKGNAATYLTSIVVIFAAVFY